jgi:aryl-alcohol dehydrogenase-like predicted oxidoreductase/choline dehydrogenase-like flavoprotein
MIFDFDSADCPAPPHADVCVLGAGAAGIALATELAAAGQTVVVLEGGGGELEARSQALYNSEVSGRAHRGIHEGRFRTFGGRTTRWGGQMLELQPIDFARREWIDGSGWPFAKAELAPLYERSLKFAGLRRVERDDATVWRELGLEPSQLGPELAQMFSRWLPERNVAVLHARTLADARRLQVYLHASATGFSMNAAGDAIAAVRVRGFSGRTVDVTAGQFVVCLGGIESARLLLQPSTEAQLPWQANGVLGRHYQDHLGVNGIEVKRLSAQPAHRYFGYVTARGFRYHDKLWMAPAEQQRLQTLNVAGTLGPLVAENAARDEAMSVIRDVVRKRRRPSGREAMQMLAHTPGIAAGRLAMHYRGEAPLWKRVMLTVHSEQAPRGDSAITLTGERDALGTLRARLNWVIGDLELHTIRSYVRLAGEVLARQGFAELAPPPGFFGDDELLRGMCGDSYHHMGATRMATTAADGIVDAQLQMHGVRNGYVCSSSVFPCSGFSNPTHTVIALALRLADKLKAMKPVAPFIRMETPAEGAAAASGMRTISLPGSGATTSQLGFGCAYLLGPGLDRAASRRLLDAAWDAGVRHFDAARLYGHGATEVLLGEFLAEHPEATVTTKFGVVPATGTQRAFIAARRLAPPLAKIPWQRQDKAVFRAAEAQAALEISLRALRRERVELFLLHEAEAADLVHDDLLEWLQRKQVAGVIGAFGVGGEYAKIPPLYAERRAYVPVLQYEHSILGPSLNVPGSYCAYYRVFAPAARALYALLQRKPEVRHSWSDKVGADLAEPEVLSQLLLRAALDDAPGALTLFSTGSEEHIFHNVEIASNAALAAPAAQLAALLHEDDHGLGRKLYGEPSASSNRDF